MTEAPVSEERTPGLASIFGLFLLAVIGTIVASTVAVVIYALASGIEFGDPSLMKRLPPLLLSVAANCIVLGVLAFVPLGKKIDRRLKKRPALMAVVVATLGTVALAQVLDSGVHWIGLEDYGSLAHIREALSGLTPWQMFGASLVIGLGPGFAEELFFRGQLLPLFNRVVDQKRAWLLSSVLFGLIHMDPLHSVLALILGLYLGLLVLWTGSLWPAIVAHTVNNMAATYVNDLPALPAWAVACALCVSALALVRLKVAGPSGTALAPHARVDHSSVTHEPH